MNGDASGGFTFALRVLGQTSRPPLRPDVLDVFERWLEQPRTHFLH
jgi:hypothetical protein